MSSVSTLNDFYGSFFKGAGYLSVSPYDLTYYGLGRLVTGGHMPFDEEWQAEIRRNGLILCVALTIIPVLPALTAITLSLALIGSALAAISTLITYPIAALQDCAIPETEARMS